MATDVRDDKNDGDVILLLPDTSSPKQGAFSTSFTALSPSQQDTRHGQGPERPRALAQGPQFLPSLAWGALRTERFAATSPTTLGEGPSSFTGASPRLKSLGPGQALTVQPAQTGRPPYGNGPSPTPTQGVLVVLPNTESQPLPKTWAGPSTAPHPPALSDPSRQRPRTQTGQSEPSP